MQMRTLATVASVLAFSASMAAQQINYDFDSSVDFSRFKTYAWTRGTNLPDELNHKRVVRAIDTQLALKGLMAVAADAGPDVLVAYHTSFDKNLQINGFGSGWAGPAFGGMRSGTATTQQLVVGQLVVDMVDARTKAIVWRGQASSDLDPGASPEKREKNINKGAEKLFKNFPPQAKK